MRFIDILNNALQYGNIDLDTFQRNPLLFAAVSKRMTYCANAKFKLFDQNDNERETDPLLTRLQYPNFHQNQREYIKSYVAQLSLTGLTTINTYSGAFPKDPARADLIPIWGVQTDYKGDLRDLVIKGEYPKFYYKKDGEKVELDENELILFFDETVTFTNPFDAISRGEASSKVVSNSDLRLDVDNTLTGMPGGLGMVSSDGANPAGVPIPINPDDKKAMEDRLQFNYGVGKGKSNWIVTQSFVKIQQIKQALKDFDLKEGNERDVEQAANIFNIPIDLMRGDSTYENQKQSEIKYIQGDIQTTMDGFCAGHLRHFDGYEGWTLKATFDHLPIMQELREKKARYLNTYFDALKKAADLGANQEDITKLVNEAL